MPTEEFETAIPVIERLQPFALDRAATRIGIIENYCVKYDICNITRPR
jgi:hypothetical protein